MKSKKKKSDKLTFFKDAWQEVELIGSGSYGKVYKAKKEEFGVSTYCAIKRIEIPQSDAELHTLKTEGMTKSEITIYFADSVKKWVEEIKFMAIFKDSPTIVNIEDYEVIEKDKKSGYIIHIRMELLQNLDDYVLENKITDKEVLKMAIDVCSALEDCEKNQVLHRDIKPDNIFVNKKGVFKVGDFGIAKKVQGTLSNLSKKGTENYMAPELYKNEKGNQTVDIYSLGVMLYRYFNYNRLPFLPDYPNSILPQDREDALYKRISGEKMVPPKNAPRDIAEIILKACNYYAKNRYQSATELKKELQEVYKNLEKETIIFDFNARKMQEIFKENNKSVKLDETISYFNSKKNNPIEETIINHKEVGELKRAKIEVEEESTSTVSIAEPLETKTINNSLTTENTAITIKNPVWVKMKSQKNIVLLLLVLLMLAGGGIYIYTSNDESRPKKEIETLVVMPKVMGKNSEEAVSALKDLGLEIEYDYLEVEDESQIGLVLEQSEPAQDEIKKGSLIKLTIAVSKEKVPVISVVGLTKTEAKTKLEEIGLRVNITEQYNADVEVGYVISQMPGENEEVYKNAIIELLVSLGSEGEKQEENKKPSTKPNNQTNQTPQVVKNWSEWVTALPSNVNANNYTIETKTEYRYQDKETTTGTKGTMDGWIKYDEVATYSNWSSNKTTTSPITASDTTKIVSSKKQWVYHHYVNWYDAQWNVDSIAYGHNEMHCSFTSDIELPRLYGYADKGNRPMYQTVWACGECQFKAWFLQEVRTTTTYQTRTKTITYYFYKWGNFSEWSSNAVTASDTRQVETRTLYRYKQK